MAGPTARPVRRQTDRRTFRPAAAAFGRLHGPAGATMNGKEDSCGCCCYTRLPAAGTSACCQDHPKPPRAPTPHSKKIHHPLPPHPTAPLLSLGWPVNAAAVEPARQRMDLKAACYWKGPLWTLRLCPSPGGLRPAPPTRPYHWPTTTFIPLALRVLMGDPSPALSGRFYPFCGHRLDPPPDGRGGAAQTRRSSKDLNRRSCPDYPARRGD